jgi:tetratricopeptide (TPR) repeat protein
MLRASTGNPSSGNGFIHSVFVCALIIPASSYYLVAQDVHHPAVSQRASAGLLPGIGDLHHPIQTGSAEAQRFFDQGLTQVYAFSFDGAITSFERASELDPLSPMPYWGIALALGPNYNSPRPAYDRERAAYEAIQKAKALTSDGLASERAYVAALVRRFTQKSLRSSDGSDRDYAAAMLALYHLLPDDPDAATLYAESLMDIHPWKLWSSRGQPSENTLEIVQVLADVIRRWPNHVGANHYYLHALEASPFPERALASAHRLETLVPAESHLVHMPAHIYFRCGDYLGAVRISMQAIALDTETTAREPGVDSGNHGQQRGSSIGYMNHNVLFLIAAAMMDGESVRASRASARIASTGHSQLFAVAPILVSLRFGEWDKLIAMTPPRVGQFGARFFWRYARGCALAAKGRPREAEKERDEMEYEYRYIQPGRAFGMFFNQWSTLHMIAKEVLDAKIALAEHQSLIAIRDFQRAVQVQDEMAFDDLPDWYYPVRESLGGTLFMSGDFVTAEKVFREDLVRTPMNPRSLFGLWKSLTAQSRSSEASRICQSLKAHWKGRKLRMKDL